MSVYVDSLVPTTVSRYWGYGQSCHLMADSSSELEEMARMLGLNPEWKQKSGTPHEHYDLTAPKRKRAVALGALSVTRREMVARLRAQS